MLTSNRVDHISQDLVDAFDKLPALISEIRETVADREALCVEISEREQVIKTQDVLISDLRIQIKELQDRCHTLVQHGAKLENVIMSAGRALANDATFQSAARELATPAPAETSNLPAHAGLSTVDATG